MLFTDRTSEQGLANTVHKNFSDEMNRSSKYFTARSLKLIRKREGAVLDNSK